MTTIRLALRTLRGTPGFAITAIVTLALAIGANSLIFSATKGLLLRPLPFPGAERLVWVYGQDAARGLFADRVSSDEAAAVARGATAFDATAVIGDWALVRADGGRRPVEWTGLRVTASLFSLLGVTPVLGRPFTDDDAGAGRPPVMMLGHERWQRDFGGDPGVLGTSLRFDGGETVYTVVGILPPGLAFPLGRSPQAGNGSGFVSGVQDFWVPADGRAGESSGGTMLARRRPDVPLPGARAEIETVARGLARDRPATQAGRSLALVPLRDQLLGVTGPALPLLQGFAGLVLLIACGNLANLMLARALQRRNELAVRTALGARAIDLLKPLLAESLVLSSVGAALGLLLARSGRDLLVWLAAGRLPLVEQIDLDGPVMLFTALLAVGTTLACGLLPALWSTRAAAPVTLGRGGARGQTMGRDQARVRQVLIVGQVALTLVLLIGAALVLRSLTRLMAVDLGYQPGRVIAADVYLTSGDAQPFFRDLHDRLRALPGVEAVGLIQSTPLTGKWTFREPVAALDASSAASRPIEMPGSFVAFDYFAAMGIPVVAGRAFTAEEFLASKSRAVILNDVAARLFFPGENPVGRRVMLVGAPRDIVGVVKATRDERLDAPPAPQWYQPVFFGASQIIIRTAGAPSNSSAGTVESVRRLLDGADPRLIVKRVEPLDTIVAASVFERRGATQLLAAFAGLALLLAIVGLYGAVNVNAVQRRREFGLRTALGAQRHQVMALVLRGGLGMTLVGIAAGLLLALPLTGLLQSLLFDVRATDPLTLTAMSLTLVCVALLACARPAWRAATVDPIIVLRAD